MSQVEPDISQGQEFERVRICLRQKDKFRGAESKMEMISQLLCVKLDLATPTCSMAYDELKTPLLLLLELVEESAELPDGVPLPEVFTVRTCSSEKPSWWSSF